MNRHSLLFLPQITFLWWCMVVFLTGCTPAASPTPAPTLVPSVASPLQEQLIGSWHITSGGPWGDNIVTFGADGTMAVERGVQAEQGTYTFTAENAISFQFPDSSGTAEIKFLEENLLSLSVMTSGQPFGSIYSAERVDAQGSP